MDLAPKDLDRDNNIKLVAATSPTGPEVVLHDEFVKDMGKLFKELRPGFPWYERFWWFICRQWDFITSIPREIKWLYQRARYGVADCDSWDFNRYLTEVVIQGVSYLRRHGHGHPISTTAGEWAKILAEIEEGFWAHLRMEEGDHDEYYSKEGLTELGKKSTEEYENAKTLLIKYWDNLWD